MAERRPTVRHSVARATLGECFCPKCAPDLHAKAEPAALLAPTASEQSSHSKPTPIAVGGSSCGEPQSALQAEVARLRTALRDAEARWLTAYGTLHAAIDAERCAQTAIRSLQRDLRAASTGLFTARAEAAELPRPWMDRGLAAALTEAQRCAIVLSGAMAECPDWRERAAPARAGLQRAFEALDALGGAS